MKKIGKLTINPEKVIKNEELVNLKGGYGEDLQRVSCFDNSGYLGYIETPYCPPESTRLSMCRDPYPDTMYTHCNL
jgi:hypothetical protein